MEAQPTDPYGYLLVHFLEDPDGYAERIYMDLSDGDNPHRWIPLNGGEPLLTSTQVFDANDTALVTKAMTGTTGRGTAAPISWSGSRTT